VYFSSIRRAWLTRCRNVTISPLKLNRDLIEDDSARGHRMRSPPRLDGDFDDCVPDERRRWGQRSECGRCGVRKGESFGAVRVDFRGESLAHGSTCIVLIPDWRASLLLPKLDRRPIMYNFDDEARSGELQLWRR
jgi:hypothetical protein